MGRLAQTDGLTEFEQDILATVRDFTGKEIIPEFIQRNAVPDRIADSVWKLYDNPNLRANMVGEMDRVIRLLGEKGAGRRAAQAVVRELRQ